MPHPMLEDMELYRQTVRAFLRRMEARLPELEAGTGVDFWREAGAAGLLGVVAPEAYGGAGADPIFYVVLAEEFGRSPVGATLGGSLIGDLTTLFMVRHGTEAQKARWLPGIVRGEVVQCMALSESGAGSDAAAIRTVAMRDGDHYVINGSKTFITNASKSHLMYVQAKTDPAARGRGISMILTPSDTPGVTIIKKKTMGFAGGDTCEIFFDDVRVPIENLLGDEGEGLRMFQPVVSLDRLQVSARSLGAAEAAFELTLAYVRDRKIFGQRLVEFQNTQFRLADMETDIALGRALLNDAVNKYLEGGLQERDCAIMKIFMPEMEFRVMDSCLQLWGGAGFMDDSVISRMFTASRVQRIYAGATELQKSMLARRYLQAA